MPLSASEHEVEVESLLWKNRPLRIWLQTIHALARNDQGLTIALGLTPEETIEFLKLELMGLIGDERRPLQELHCNDRIRYEQLYEKLHVAICRDVLENDDFWMRPRTVH